VGEDYTLALAAKLVLRHRRGPVVTNLSTSRVVEDVAAAAGAAVIRAPVGEVNVALRMRAEGAAVGGEGNGGVILPELHLGRDAPLGAAIVLQLLLESGGPLSAVVDDHPRYVIVKDKLDRPDAPLDAVYAALVAAFPDAERDTQDGLRLSWAGPLGARAAERHRADRARHRRGARRRGGARAGLALARAARRPRRGRLGLTRPSSPLSSHCHVRHRRIRRQPGGHALLIEGLKRLEYRGYDSAGVAVQNGGGVETRKAAGKIARLEAAIGLRPVDGTFGIAHTRWATHGPPTERNAHPHTDEKCEVAVVHNGIIENAPAIRTLLEQAGHTIASETDTEVLAHLIESAYDGCLEDAVLEALAHVEGTYGIAVMHGREPARSSRRARGARCSSASATASTSSPAT
jgi:hypothetical protein